MPKEQQGAEDTVTLTKKQLEELVAGELKKQQRDPKENQLRNLIGEVVDERLEGFFERAAEEELGNGPGDKSTSLWDQAMGWLAGEGQPAE